MPNALGNHGATVSTYLVTGNTRHFPKMPLVATPKEMVEILARRLDKSHIEEG